MEENKKFKKIIKNYRIILLIGTLLYLSIRSLKLNYECQLTFTLIIFQFWIERLEITLSHGAS